MPVRSATYWEVTCDHDGCGVGLFDITCEWTAMAHKESAAEIWTDAEGVVLPDGRALCRDHRPSCEGCDGWLDDPAESIWCEDCVDAHVTPKPGVPVGEQPDPEETP